ncbi:DUF2797 domain-containing protein [Neiella marina]|uniref:DUF2797 domain-containing protein n=1 Tax=Neiella holothuriorum TaxID=2870530 RepID=A0ABS7ED59_9GAMM|nr:DUF2797 domain-containing protein [Neiella holothuriorum]MBW8190185.1 DUF2797 domain-containing protein [Neiella holothuriorum]
MQGTLKKLQTSLNDANEVVYQLPVGEQLLPLNPLIGSKLKLSHTGKINCCNCGKVTKKSYSQGHCFVCMKKLASCDMCIMKPETCHYAQGTCREPSWGEANCFVPHYVYLSNTSGVKVGITRHTQIPTRWIDQGATQGLPIFKVKSRHVSGLVEIALAKLVADKTHWQAMLKGNNENIDLNQKAAELIPLIEDALTDIIQQHGADAIERLDQAIQPIHYPITQFPLKVKSYNLDKAPQIDDVLVGIKGQYLIFENGVINIRKYTSYDVVVEA